MYSKQPPMKDIQIVFIHEQNLLSIMVYISTYIFESFSPLSSYFINNQYSKRISKYLRKICVEFILHCAGKN